MAKKRMLNPQITESDQFLELPPTAQNLYFHLNIRADDDGFVNSPKSIQRIVRASDTDFNLLIMNKFIIAFESGVIVIKHWRIHNYIQTDRYHETTYVEEKSRLSINKNKSYSLIESCENAPCIQNVYKMDTQISLDKFSLDKINEEEIGLFETFEQEFKRTLSPFEFELINELRRSYSDELIKLALLEAVKNNALSFKYVQTILINWNSAGVVTVDEAQKKIEQFKNRKNTKQDKINEWKVEDELHEADDELNEKVTALINQRKDSQ